MNKNRIALGRDIAAKALSLGFDQCGIIKADAVRQYANQLEERMKQFPESRPFYEAQSLPLHAFPEKSHPWAKSIVVCISHYGKYRIPGTIDRHIGKYYLFDYRKARQSQEYAAVASFESYLNELGLQTAKDLFGITAMRWAAVKANLGVIRKNNFLSTRRGSWVWIETWYTDAEIEYLADEQPPACPENCTRCIDACPTGALSGPYSMHPGKCVTRLNCGLGVKGLVPEPLRSKMGPWIYGCDACQNACPMNHGKWESTLDFPGLNELAPDLTPESLVEMDDQQLSEKIFPKFWYIRTDSLWRWKCNALSAMADNGDSKYYPYLKKARHDGNEYVQELAVWACDKLGL